MLHLLHLDMEGSRRTGQTPVAGIIRGSAAEIETQRRAPERRRGLQILRTAIDDETREPAAMHARDDIMGVVNPAADLPVLAALPQLRAALATAGCAVLIAPPGAGKSTVVPLELLGEPWAAGRRILMLEPRRLAARAVATRMAQSLGERVGETVGYRMRLDTRVGPRTRLEVITEGILTRLLQQDPALGDAAAVIFDEFHERSLQADLGLALALEARATIAPQLRLLVMSATLDAGRVAALLDDAPVVSASGRSFPVAVQYAGQGLPQLPDTFGRLPLEALAATVRRVLEANEGDVLVFLPGAPEIHRLRRMLEDSGLPAGVTLHALFGEQEAALQQQALERAPAGRRKLILATNVAETSLTIDGVTVVVDSGVARRSLFDPVTGMSRLETVRISRASAEQRAGRAGRTAPGLAVRIWSEGAQATLPAQTPAEILTADLAPLALELAHFVDSVAKVKQPKVGAALGKSALEVAITITEQIRAAAK